MAAKFEKNGVKIVEPIFTTPDGGRALFIEGPDKVLIEILEVPSS
jgi:predicted enzyme related to lactoylglutathione lyase